MSSIGSLHADVVLGYPGGRVLDALARTGDRDAIVFLRGMTGPRDERLAFGFSGLKPAVPNSGKASRVIARPM